MSSAAAARVLLSALAVVLPDVVRERAERAVVGGIVVERPLTPTVKEPRIGQALQVVAQRRGGHVDVSLNVAGGDTLIAPLNHEAEDRQAHGMTESAQL